LKTQKPKAKQGNTAESAADEGGEVLPSKKPKVTKVSDVDMEQKVKKPTSGKQKKESIREAIAAIQQATSADSSREVAVTVAEEGEKSKDVVSTASIKRFGDGPQWNQQGKGGTDIKGTIKRPNQYKDQIDLPGDAT
jgi:hypothetical protein